MRRTLAKLTLLAASLGPAVAALQAAPRRFPVTPAEVAAALAAQRPELPVTGLDIPSITSATPDPALVIGALRAFSPETADVRVDCRDSGDCLPFYVRVHSPAAGQLARVARTETAQAPRPQTRTAQPAPPAVRSGARAVLHIDSGGLHITLPVICLAAGNVGSAIRVTGMDRRKIYTVRILSPTLMEGSL
jgi:hypothetical protein